MCERCYKPVEPVARVIGPFADLPVCKECAEEALRLNLRVEIIGVRKEER